ncbi:MAG: NAD(P)H-dependent glycerol-3-phosphate dehydrogenase [Candidatus Zixiibacteriota bacterium]
MSEHVTILGGGSWGMAVARLLDMNGQRVTVWEFNEADYKKLVEVRGNSDKLPGFRLADSIRVTHDLFDAVDGCRLLVIAVPSQFLRATIKPLRSRMRNLLGVVNLAKGIENKTLKRMSEVIVEESGLPVEKVATLSGPSHAEEVIHDLPTTVVAAGHSEKFVVEIQELFSNNSFRVYKSPDLIGVELGGSLKNIIAIATGIADGLALGDNTKGALITRGLAEITRLGLAMGASLETFAGLSGIGDLVTTCISRHSRNRWVGERIGLGEKLDDILRKMKMVAEGVQTTRSGYELARLHQVEMPITAVVHEVLFENMSPLKAVEQLMGRTLKSEIWQ